MLWDSPNSKCSMCAQAPFTSSLKKLKQAHKVSCVCIALLLLQNFISEFFFLLTHLICMPVCGCFLPCVMITSLRYGCCQDSVTQAHGPNKEGCPEYVPLVPAVSISYSSQIILYKPYLQFFSLHLHLSLSLPSLSWDMKSAAGPHMAAVLME